MNTRFVGRVNKLDALQLDHSIQQIIREQQFLLRDGIFTRLLDYQRELNLLSSSVIWWYSFRKHHATLGQQLLALKYDGTKLNRRTLAWHWFFQVLLPNYHQIGDGSRYTIVRWLDNVYIVAKLFTFFKFCYTGERPNLTDEFLKLDLHSTEIKRTVSYGYQSRELIWNGFIEFLVFIIPMINFQMVRNRFRRLVRGSSGKDQIYKVPVFTTTTTCVYCRERPTMPHHIGCGHVYCYYCLMGNFKADPSFSCVECGSTGKVERLGEY